MKRFKKILKISAIVFVILLIAVYILFVNFSSRKSNQEIKETFSDSGTHAFISTRSYQDFNYRVVGFKKKLTLRKQRLFLCMARLVLLRILYSI